MTHMHLFGSHGEGAEGRRQEQTFSGSRSSAPRLALVCSALGDRGRGKAVAWRLRDCAYAPMPYVLHVLGADVGACAPCAACLHVEAAPRHSILQLALSLSSLFSQLSLQR